MNKYITPIANSSVQDILGDFVSLFFPRVCAGCKNSLVKGEEFICTKCIIEIPRSNYHKERENRFYQKLMGRIPLLYVMSFLKFSKGGRVQSLLHELKYRNQPLLGRKLGSVFGEELELAGYRDSFDMVVPVPLHANKKKLRGYNQSEEFGLGVADALSIPCSEVLVRTRATSTQTRKSRISRWENVKDVFTVAGKDDINGKRVLLVDDVVTTGATLEAAGRALTDGGCRELSIACIATTE